jgi:hypothetical protein
MNSLHRIALTTLTILSTSTFLYLLWKSFSFIGRPLGRCLTNLTTKPSDEDSSSSSNNNNHNNDDNTTGAKLVEHQQSQQSLKRTSSFLGAMLGFFISAVLFPLALDSAERPQWYSGGGESERLIWAGLWVGWVAVKCWGETLVVLGVLSGVVKGVGIDGGAAADAGGVGGIGGEEKDSKRGS